MFNGRLHFLCSVAKRVLSSYLFVDLSVYRYAIINSAIEKILVKMLIFWQNQNRNQNVIYPIKCSLIISCFEAYHSLFIGIEGSYIWNKVVVKFNLFGYQHSHLLYSRDMIIFKPPISSFSNVLSKLNFILFHSSEVSNFRVWRWWGNNVFLPEIQSLFWCLC